MVFPVMISAYLSKSSVLWIHSNIVKGLRDILALKSSYTLLPYIFSGEIWYDASQQLDYETIDIYRITIHVFDSKGIFSVAELNVLIADVIIERTLAPVTTIYTYSTEYNGDQGKLITLRFESVLLGMFQLHNKTVVINQNLHHGKIS